MKHRSKKQTKRKRKNKSGADAGSEQVPGSENTTRLPSADELLTLQEIEAHAERLGHPTEREAFMLAQLTLARNAQQQLVKDNPEAFELIKKLEALGTQSAPPETQPSATSIAEGEEPPPAPSPSRADSEAAPKPKKKAKAKTKKSSKRTDDPMLKKGNERTLRMTDTVLAMLKMLARYRGLDLNSAVSVAVAEDYRRIFRDAPSPISSAGETPSVRADQDQAVT